MDAAAARYLHLVRAGDPAPVLELFAGPPAIDDPRHGRVEGRQELARVVEEDAAWLAERATTIEPVRTIVGPERTVAELVLHLEGTGPPVALPVALVGDGGPREQARELRLYFSVWALTGVHRLRPAVLEPDPLLELSDVVARYQDALGDGDLAMILAQFEPDGLAREPAGGAHVHRGREGLERFYRAVLANGGGVGLEHCTATDDGVACALEYNCVLWGRDPLPPQAGVAVYERGPNGLLAAARIYDDVDPPVATS
jgi:hypothetical protein